MITCKFIIFHIHHGYMKKEMIKDFMKWKKEKKKKKK